MKAWLPLALIFCLASMAYAQDAGTASASAPATCTHPGPASHPPDGATASKDDMIAGQKAMRAYAAEMDDYLKCVSAQIDAIPSADPKTLKGDEKAQAERNMKEKEQLVKKYDAALDDEKASAEAFNVQLRIWKAKQKG